MCAGTEETSPAELPEEIEEGALDPEDSRAAGNELILAYAGRGYRPLASVADLLPIFGPAFSTRMIPLGEWRRRGVKETSYIDPFTQNMYFLTLYLHVSPE